MTTTAPATEIVTIPCLKDNYAFALHLRETGQTLIVDVPEAAPIVAECARRGWVITDVLLTHHHWDHVDGLPDLHAATDGPIRVWGAAADAHRLPALDHALHEGDVMEIGALRGTVYDVSGHTVGHIAVHFPQAGVIFTADSLMALGCGRLFEGTPAQMWQSLSKLTALPRDTLVCSGHEYTQSNARFALTIDPENKALQARATRIDEARAKGLPTVPSSLGMELDTNPFLRANDPQIKAHLGMTQASDAECFAEIRQRKDHF